MLTKNTIKQVASLRQQKFRKELGDYTAKIRLHKEVSVDVDFTVFAE